MNTLNWHNGLPWVTMKSMQFHINKVVLVLLTIFLSGAIEQIGIHKPIPIIFAFSFNYNV